MDDFTDRLEELQGRVVKFQKELFTMVETNTQYTYQKLEDVYNELTTAWEEGDWQVQVLMIEAGICVFLLLAVYIMWSIYKDPLTELLSGEDLPTSPSAQHFNNVNNKKND